MTARSQRQSFLGDAHEEIFATTLVGIVGLGGGGSHVAQQLGHLGFKRIALYDPDVVEESNLNRLIGATEVDAKEGRLKVAVAARLLRGLWPTAEIHERPCRWEDDPLPLRECAVIFGCVDSFQARRDLEVCARRYMIPYIDIGIDLHEVPGSRAALAGQVILSMPGYPCMRCLGFLTDENIAKEAARYGKAAGGRPQVVWPNGVLGSAAVGIAVDLLTDWSGSTRGPVYLSYRGETGTVVPHVRLGYVDLDHCPHFPDHVVGDPELKSL